MKLYDSHCHFEQADRDKISTTLARAQAAGVEKIMAVGGSPALDAGARLAAALAAEDVALPRVRLATGFDRDQLSDEPTPERIARLDFSDCSAWGEIGLDYHYSPETRGRQRELFAAQLAAARERDLPVIIHTREAAEDTIALLGEIPSRGVIHCFTGDAEEAKAYLELGFFVSISGIVTFRLADNVREMAKTIPDDRLLIETDSPFLAPVPKRGNPNEPAFVAHTCEFLAALRGTTAEALAELTFANAEELFG